MGRKSRAAAVAARDRAAAAAAAARSREAPAARGTSTAKRRKTRAVPAERDEAKAMRLIDESDYPEAPHPTPCMLNLKSRSSRDRNSEDLKWRCDCGKLNLPRRCLIADIPVLECECGRKADIDFDFSLGHVTINDKDPIVETNIKTQGMSDCLLCATASNIELTLQMRSILSGEVVECPVIDLKDLHSKYSYCRNRYKFILGEKWNASTITILASIAKHKGVVCGKGSEATVHKIPEYLKVKYNFYDIVRVLADGYPLTTGIITGKKFEQLKPGKIYKAPSDDKFVDGKCRIGHAILLIGAGRRGGVNYYHFINSWGMNFCVQEDKRRYGFGMIRASDIRIQPLKFVRYEEDIEYHKSLASTDLSEGDPEESYTPTAYHLNEKEKTKASASAEEIEGQPVEMDDVSVIATFPSEIPEEVLLTSPDTLLATLIPALFAEANMFRERFAHRYHSGSLFGMNSRNRRGESSRLGDIICSGLVRNSGHSSCQTASKLTETEGTPLVDKDALNALIRLLRVIHFIYKGQLQRPLLNLCAHRESRNLLVQILVDMLMLDLQGSSKKLIDATDPSLRLYGCHANITYSCPQSSDGLPSLVSRCVLLETLTYLNDISDVLDLTFSMDADEEKLILYEKAKVADCELIPGGHNIRVTEVNKHEYVDGVAKHRLTTAIRPQINPFMEGFNELFPRELMSIFSDKEFGLLISGLPDIDFDDLKANTEYSGYSIASPVIQWLCEIFQGFSKDKARFLQFVTGTSKVCLEGFSALQGKSGPQKLQIHKAYGRTNHLPSAHTCFNQLDLPEYTSKGQLQERLLLAIHEAKERFGVG